MEMLYRCESSIFARVHTSLFTPIHFKPEHLIYNRRNGSHIKRQVRDINFTEELTLFYEIYSSRCHLGSEKKFRILWTPNCALVALARHPESRVNWVSIWKIHRSFYWFLVHLDSSTPHL